MTAKKRLPGFHHRTAVSTLFRSTSLKAMEAPAASSTRTSELGVRDHLAEASRNSRLGSRWRKHDGWKAVTPCRLRIQDLGLGDDFGSGLLRGKCPRRWV